MTLRNRLRLAVALAPALLCLPARGQMSGPITGLVYDPPTRSLRQILGMPGAARMGEPLAAEIDWASVAPDGRTAIVVRGTDTQVVTMREGLVGLPLSEAVDVPQLAVWSSDSESAALYSEAGRSLRWIRLSEYAVEAEVALPVSGSYDSIAAIAADGTSRTIALAVLHAGIVVFSPGIDPRQLCENSEVTVLAFEPGGRRLWAAARDTAEILEIASLPGDPQISSLMSDAGKLPEVSAIALSSDGGVLYLADRAMSKLYMYSREWQQLSEGMALDAPATLMTRLGRPTLYLMGLRSAPGEPLFLLDETLGPGVLFVPSMEGWAN